MNLIRSLIFSLALLPFLGLPGTAQSTTQIADTVHNPDGSLFTGTVVITWTGASSPYGNNPLPYSTSVKVYNGVLSVSVVPTVAYSAYYLVVYNSSDGRTSWVENWQVGPSSSALTLSQVRTALASTPTSTGGTTIGMGQITGLSAYLNAISSSVSTVSATVGGFNTSLATLSNSVSNLNAEVSALQTTGVSGSGSSVWVEGEIPAGTVNGTNSSFLLANTPVANSSVMLFRNGVLLAPNNDFSFSGKNITFAQTTIPQSGDVLQVSYRTAAPPPSVAFVDNETPTGSLLVYRLASAPASNTLRLYKNGALLQAGVDFTVTGATITFAGSVSAPSTGDTLSAYYRVTTT